MQVRWVIVCSCYNFGRKLWKPTTIPCWTFTYRCHSVGLLFLVNYFVRRAVAGGSRYQGGPRTRSFFVGDLPLHGFYSFSNQAKEWSLLVTPWADGLLVVNNGLAPLSNMVDQLRSTKVITHAAHHSSRSAILNHQGIIIHQPSNNHQEAWATTIKKPQTWP